jgi:predicted amino acid dehydrogenase
MTSHAKQPEICLGKYAFLMHPPSPEDLFDSGPEGFDRLSPECRAKWEKWVASWSERHYKPGIAYYLPKLRSRAGGYAEGWLIAIPLTPIQLMRLKPADKRELLAECVEIAKDLGVDMLGLGAFTSIISRGGNDLLGCGLNITTGNSLTAFAAAESLKDLALRIENDFPAGPLGIVGAAGSVGQLATRKLGEECADLTLFGNPSNPQSLRKLAAVGGRVYRDALERIARGERGGVAGVLESLADDLAEDAHFRLTDSNLYEIVNLHFTTQGIAPPVKLTDDLREHLPRMKFVLSATSQGAAFIDSGLLSSGAIVCDASRPADVQADVREKRSDVFVYEGGLMELPEPISFGRRNIVGCPNGVNLSCLSETITLAMAGVRRSCSIGSDLSLEEGGEIFRQAKYHGFRPYMPEFPMAVSRGAAA